MLAVIILIQISLPGFCCIANRAARSTARLIGFVAPDGEFAFWNSNCCGKKCCITDSRPDADCCAYTDDCACGTGNQSQQSSSSTESTQDSSNQPKDPNRHKLCECLESDPMLPPSATLIDMEMDQFVLEVLDAPYAISRSQTITTARYHPPPLRRHLFLCVIRC